MDLLYISFGAPVAPQGPVALQQPLPPLKHHQSQPMAATVATAVIADDERRLVWNGPPLPPARVPDGVSPVASVGSSTDSIMLDLVVAAKQDDSIEAQWELAGRLFRLLTLGTKVPQMVFKLTCCHHRQFRLLPSRLSPTRADSVIEEVVTHVLLLTGDRHAHTCDLYGMKHLFAL